MPCSRIVADKECVAAVVGREYKDRGFGDKPLGIREQRTEESARVIYLFIIYSCNIDLKLRQHSLFGSPCLSSFLHSVLFSLSTASKNR